MTLSPVIWVIDRTTHAPLIVVTAEVFDAEQRRRWKIHHNIMPPDTASTDEEIEREIKPPMLVTLEKLVAHGPNPSGTISHFY